MFIPQQYKTDICTWIDLSSGFLTKERAVKICEDHPKQKTRVIEQATTIVWSSPEREIFEESGIYESSYGRLWLYAPQRDEKLPPWVFVGINPEKFRDICGAGFVLGQRNSFTGPTRPLVRRALS